MYHMEDDEDEMFADEPSIAKEAPPPNDTENKPFFTRLRDGFIDFFSKHPSFLHHTQSILSAIIDFNTVDLAGRKEPLKIINGAISFVDGIKSANFQSVWSFLSIKNGYTQLYFKKINVASIFKDIVEKYPSRTIKFLDGNFIQVFTLPIGDVYSFAYSQSEYYLYYNFNNVEEKKLLEFLVQEKLNVLNSNFLVYQRNEANEPYELKAFNPEIMTSKRADEILKSIKQFISAGINRSMLFFGPPGTGKTSLANAIVHSLQFRTLMFSASYDVNAIAILDFITDLFNIEAVIIDDFDQLGSSNKQLDLLEMLNRKMKLVIGVANQLNLFH